MSSRKEVEAYLRQKNISFLQMCCINGDNSKHALDDLTKIGQEDAPWFCSENNIYVAFQFDDKGRHGPHWDANESDVLSKITIFRWLEGCL